MEKASFLIPFWTHHYGRELLCPCVCFSFTFKAEHSVFFTRVWVASLVFKLVKRTHTELALPTLGLRDGDWVADAAVRQPAVVAAVKPRPPSRVQVARWGQHGVVLLTLVPGLLQGEFLAEGWRIEDLTFRQREQKFELKVKYVKSERLDVTPVNLSLKQEALLSI